LAELAAYELEGVRYLNNFLHSGSCTQRFNFGPMPVVADGSYDGPFSTVNYVSLIAAFFDSFDYVFNLSFGGEC
jgi:hypothetical protein